MLGNKLKMKKIDFQKNPKSSFGNPVQQMVELHFNGKPFPFQYSGPMEKVSIDDVDPNEEIILPNGEKYLGEEFEEGEKFEADTSKISFWRIFPKSTLRVKYLATYDYDLLSNARQVPYSETSMGSKKIKTFEISLILLTTLFFDAAWTSFALQGFSFSNVSQSTAVDWYLPLVILVLAGVALYVQHFRDISKTMVKYMMLQALPMKLSVTSVLPVALMDSTNESLWNYQERLGFIEHRDVEKILSVLQNWDDSQLESIFVEKTILHKEKELMAIANAKRALQKEDYEIMHPETNDLLGRLGFLAIGVLVTAVAAFLMFMGGA